jgi:hypothetical protein
MSDAPAPIAAPTTAAAVSEVLSPAPASPPGTVSWRDAGNAVLAALVKSGAIFVVLAAMGAWAGTIQNKSVASAVAGFVALSVQILRAYVGGPPKPVEFADDDWTRQ